MKDYLRRRYRTEVDEDRLFVQPTTSSNLHVRRLHSKRGVLQRSKTIDMDDGTSSNDDTQPSSEKEGNADLPRSRSFQPSSTDSHRLFFPSFDHEGHLSPLVNRLSLPVTPYSAASDPGPYHSPWSHTPPSPSVGLLNFQFPHPQWSLVQLPNNSLSVPPCQICQQRFDSHQT